MRDKLEDLESAQEQTAELRGAKVAEEAYKTETNENIARSSTDTRSHIDKVETNLGGKLDLLLQRGQQQPAEEEVPAQVEIPVEMPMEIPKEIPSIRAQTEDIPSIRTQMGRHVGRWWG